MGAIASRSLQTTRKSQGWASWILLAIPFIGIGGLVFESSHHVTKPQISLFQAVDNNDLTAIKNHSLSGTDMNQIDVTGHTALYLAIANEDDAAARELLQDGANPNKDQANLETPLMLAAGQGDTSMVGALLNAGAMPNAGTRDGMTAIYEGTCSGSAQVVQLLINKGADPNESLGTSGATPLTIAAWQGSLAMVHELINAGARVNAKTDQGKTPLDQARARHHDNVVNALLAVGAQ